VTFWIHTNMKLHFKNINLNIHNIPLRELRKIVEYTIQRRLRNVTWRFGNLDFKMWHFSGHLRTCVTFGETFDTLTLEIYILSPCPFLCYFETLWPSSNIFNDKSKIFKIFWINEQDGKFKLINFRIRTYQLLVILIPGIRHHRSQPSKNKSVFFVNVY